LHGTTLHGVAQFQTFGESMNSTELRDIATDAISYWEPRRIIYNLILGLIVMGYFVAGLPYSRDNVSFDSILGFFVLAVLANIAYCAAYPVDVFAQLSGFRDLWRRFRWILLFVGIAFAAIITRIFAMSFTNAS